MDKIIIAYCPTRRNVFSREKALEYSKIILNRILQYDNIEIIDLKGINEEEMLFEDSDLTHVIERFKNAKVDAVFFPHCNFGSENLVAQVAKALHVPVLLWGPRDSAPSKDGYRDRDSQCGLFATGKVLRRHNVPFTYLVNSTVESEEFHKGFERFIAVANVVKSMHNLRILQISTRPEPFCSVICNENELLERFDIHIYPITLTDLQSEAERVIRENSPELITCIDFICSHSCEDNKENILKVAAIKFAMRNLAKKYRCRAVAIQCWDSLQTVFGVMPCLANALLTDEGIPVACETDIHGAITSIILQAASMGAVPFFADVTVRHPNNDNAELLWHCGNFPYSLAANQKEATFGRNMYNADHCFGICNWSLINGPLTIARFDGDHGEYHLLIGEAHTTDGPKNAGSYVWMETSNWPKWERTLVEGPYIHHVAACYGHIGEILLEACKYIPYLEPDTVEPTVDELLSRW